LANADALTKESINAAVKKYFDPNNLKILVYAPRAKAEASLRKLGKVEVKPYREFLR
jgi:predicted Zn-dependent peptidase